MYIFKVNKNNNKTICVAEIKSMSEKKFSIPKNVSVKLIRKNYTSVLRVNIPNIRQEIPIFIIFRALGIESDKEILKYILHDISPNNNKLVYLVRESIVEASDVISQV